MAKLPVMLIDFVEMQFEHCSMSKDILGFVHSRAKSDKGKTADMKAAESRLEAKCPYVFIL